MPTSSRPWPRPLFVLGLLASLVLGVAPAPAAQVAGSGSEPGSIWGAPAGVAPYSAEDPPARAFAADHALR